MEQRMSLVSLGVKDILRARTFYNSLGWQESKYSDDHIVFYQLNGFILGLFSLDKLLEYQNLKDATDHTGAITLGINTRTKQEVDDILKSFTDNGGKVLAAPEITPWGSYTGYGCDTEGHSWEISYFEAMMPDKDGNLVIK